MDQHTEEWIDKVLNSTRGMQRAQPSPGLLARIEQQIRDRKAEKVSASHWWLAAAAAIILLVINLLATRQLLQTETLERPVPIETASAPLLSDYNFYEL